MEKQASPSLFCLPQNLHCVQFFHQTGFFPSSGIFMDDAFLGSLIDGANSSGQKGFRLIRLFAVDGFQRLAGRGFDRRSNSEIFRATFCVRFYTTYRGFNIRQVVHLLMTILLKIY